MNGKFVAVLLAGTSLMHQPASAQVPPAGTGPAEPTDSTTTPVKVEGTNAAPEITVTARRRDERLMEVPVVITALSAETVARYNANDLTAIGELTPTVIIGAYKANGGGSIAIRGISSPANQTGFEQAVSVAIDGVQTSNGRIAQLGFFDVDQVEVLKGPQALFFGKNATAGIISIRTAGPTSSFRAGLKANYEFVADEATVDGYVSGPLGPTIGARLAVRYRNSQGWLRNTAQPTTNPFYNAATGAPAAARLLPGTNDRRPGEDELLGRLTLTYNDGPLKGTLKVLGVRGNDSGAGVATQNIGPCTGPNPRVSGIPDPFGECKIDNRTTLGDVAPIVGATFRIVPTDGTSDGRMDAVLTSLDVDYELGSVTLSSLTGYNYFRYSTFSGLDQTTFSQLAQAERLSAKELSQEFRLATNFEGSINFVVGAYFQDAKLRSASDTKLNDGQYNAAANRFSAFETYAAQNGKTISAFGQALWDITPEVELAGGARWTKEKKSFDKYNAYGIGTFNIANTTFPGSSTLGHLQGRFRDSNVSPEVTLRWSPDRNHTVFAAYRTGFKSGGFGLTNPTQTTTRIDSVDFNSEKAKGFEVGSRLIGFNGRLNASVAAFAYDFTNLQVNTYDPALIAYTINNAGRVRQRGFEAEANFRATPDLTVHGALAYVRNRFDDFVGQCYAYTFPTGSTRATATPPINCSFLNATSLTLQQVYDGRAPARSPTWSGNAGLNYTVPLANEREIRLNGDAFYSGSYFAADTLAPPTQQDAFWRFNAGLTYAGPNNAYTVSLIGRNLTNKYYLLYAADRTGGAGVPGAIGEQRGVIARGREVSLQASVKF